MVKSEELWRFSDCYLKITLNSFSYSNMKNTETIHYSLFTIHFIK